MARVGQIFFLRLRVHISFIIIIVFFIGQTASKLDSNGMGSGCQSDYCLSAQKPYCGETCKKIGIKGTNLYFGDITFPSGLFGVYSMSGIANCRTKYTKAGGWMIQYGCVEDATKSSLTGSDDDGDRDAWYVTQNGESSGAVVYSQYDVTCPSDSERFRFARMSPGMEWVMTGGEVPHDGPEDFLIFVCNPVNEEDFAPGAAATEKNWNWEIGMVVTGFVLFFFFVNGCWLLVVVTLALLCIAAFYEEIFNTNYGD